MFVVTIWLAALVTLDPIGSGLGDGVQLVYESAGLSQAPWVYDSVQVVPRDRFVRCVVTTRRDQAPRESCARDDTLFERRESGDYAVVRPIGPNMELDVRTASGDVLHYSTGTAETRNLGGASIAYLPTTIVTRSKDGVITRRLQEHYAPSLLTAVWGVFEEPAPDDSWRAVREFSLARIVR